METIGMRTTTTTTTTSGGEIDSRSSSSGGDGCSKAASAVVSPSIDFQSSERQQQQELLQPQQQQSSVSAVTKAVATVTVQASSADEGAGDTAKTQTSAEPFTSNKETTAGNERLNGDSDGLEHSSAVECKDSCSSDSDPRSHKRTHKEVGTTNHSNYVSLSEQETKTEEKSDNDSSATNLVTVTTTDDVAATPKHGQSEGSPSKCKIHGETEDGLTPTPTPTPPVPNFCVEGSGDGDSSVTVVTLPSSGGGVNSSCLSSSLASDISCSSGTSRDGTIEVDVDESDDVAGSGSAPLSVQSSEDMKLSLVSWYSEPEDTSRDCCQTNFMSRCITATSTPKSANSAVAGSHIISNKSSSKSCSKATSQGGVDAELQSLDAHADSSGVTAGSCCDEKENKTPMRSNSKSKGSNVNSKGKSVNGAHQQAPSQRLKMHVQLLEQQNSSSETERQISSHSQVGGDGVISSGGGHGHQSLSNSNKKMECPRCARRSKSGTTTPATGPPSRSLRRVVQSSKSSQELKKPIKSILKSDSRGSGSRSGSGSEKQSSMDSLGSSSGIACVMTRSEGSGGVGRTKFNFNSESLSSSSYSPEEKTASKLKRIEKYATLRLRKPRVKPLEFGGTSEGCCSGSVGDGHGSCCDHLCKSCSSQENHHSCKHVAGHSNGQDGSTPDVMSKSMSFLEKSSHSSTPATASLKRQGSLRIRKPSPMWEPSGTRTSALRMQKMQEAKAKTNNNISYNNNCSSSCGGKILFSSNHHSNHSGSNHSGSGESIHTQHHHGQYGHHSHSHTSSSSNHVNSSNGGVYLNNNNASHNSNSCSSNSRDRVPKDKQQHHHHQQPHSGAKVFTKLSSASGQTTSSAMKRLRQERAVQTDPLSTFVLSPTGDGQSPIRISPVPTYDQATDEMEQIKNLEILAQRYRNTALRFQHEFEKSELKNRDLSKQLQETQSETSEMIDFLQAEKSTLAESLVEIENEGKKWQEQVDSVKKEAQSRCSSLVRLSEQHKQEALKSQALLNRLEAQSNAIICKQSAELSEAALTIQQTRQRIVTLIDKLLKTYKVPRELVTATSSADPTSQSGTVKSSDDSDLNSSLLLPLISSLLNAFPSSPHLTKSTSSNDLKRSNSSSKPTSIASNDDASSVVTTVIVDNGVKSSAVSSTSMAEAREGNESDDQNCASTNEGLSNLSSSLQNLNQAILEREAAEMDLSSSSSLGLNESGLENIHDGDHLSIKTETDKLNRTLAQLVTTIRIIVIHCDKKVSGVTSNILQCLRSIEEEKGGKIPEMVSVQKSLEAWSDGMRQCKITSPTSKIFIENGHSHA